MTATSDPAGSPRLSSIIQDDLLKGVVEHFQRRTGAQVWFQDISGYTVAPEAQVPAYCTMLVNLGRCGLANTAVEMPADPAVPHFRTCIGGIGHVVLPIRHHRRGGAVREIGRLISEPVAIRETVFSELLGESRHLHAHPDNLAQAARKIRAVDPAELRDLVGLLSLTLQRVADDRSNRARNLAVAEAFEEVGMHANQEVIRDLLATLVRDFCDADAVMLSTHAGEIDSLAHQASFDESMPAAEREVLLSFTGEVIRWISQTGYPISFPDLGASAWRRHVLGGRDLEGSLVAVPVKLPGSWRGWWSAYHRTPMTQMEDQLHRLSVLAAHSAQTLTFVAQLEASQEKAMTDSLTGLPNRRFLQEQLERELARSIRSRYPVSMVLLDVDDFKHINDRHGHRVGDEALRLVAGALAAPLRRSSTVCRFGGDEFCVIIPECTPEEAIGVAERLREEVASRVLDVAGVGAIGLRVSAGVATQDPSAPGPQDLLEMADQALILAKREGKDRVLASSAPGSAPALLTDRGRIV